MLEISLIWEEIYFEYCEITSNHKLKSILKKQCLIQEWETIYYIVSKCIDIFDTYGKEEALYLINNLIESLLFAILLIAGLMAYMFRSAKMILVSVITNILPLCITSGLMGYLGIPLKPSTILVFSIAFGISVDNAIQFMAKYRHDLKMNNQKIKKSVFSALQETGVSTFYTSIVLIFGFAIFTLSSFSGTVALGGLISCTLLFAMFANLLVLPALVLTFEKKKAKLEE